MTRQNNEWVIPVGGYISHLEIGSKFTQLGYNCLTACGKEFYPCDIYYPAKGKCQKCERYEAKNANKTHS